MTERLLSAMLLSISIGISLTSRSSAAFVQPTALKPAQVFAPNSKNELQAAVGDSDCPAKNSLVAIVQEQGVPRPLFEGKLTASGLRALWQVPGVDAEAPASVRENARAIITVNAPITAAILGQYPNAKHLAVAFTGYGVHDLEACRQASVVVSNVPDYSSDSVAELALGLTLAVYRKIPAGDSLVKQMGWGLDAGTELRGKIVGIAGTGTIGVRTARLFKAFGCQLIGWSRSVNPQFVDLGGKYVDRAAFWSTADVVSIHIANNAETREMIGRNDLSLLRKSAVLINTARGQVIDEAALGDLLQAKRFRAGLDVYSTEAPPTWARDVGDAAVLMPHVAYKTTEALARKADITIANIVAGLNGHPTNQVA